jgi:tripartite-type tricarboxylate transporter receptor subunit TctC
MQRLKIRLKSLLAVAACALAFGTAAQEPYPSRPVKILVPFAPGGGTDFIARVLADRLGQKLGKPFVVENRLGAGGNIAGSALVKSPPDGHTLMLVSSSYAVAAAVSNPPFDAINDVVPVAQVVDSPLLVAVNPALPVNTLAELKAYAAANPNKISYGSTGVGTVAHLAAEYWLQLTDTKAVHIPYQGMGPAITGVVSGDVQMVFSDAGAIANMLKAGKARPLAIGGNKHFDQLPGVPTVAEAGTPDMMLMTWYGLLAPRDTPPAVVNLLNAEINTIIRSKDVVDQFNARFMTPTPSSPAQFSALLRDEYELWKKLAAQRGIKAQ